MDFYLKKRDIDEIDSFFDVDLKKNTLTIDDTLVTSVIISVFTNASEDYIGAYINSELGNPFYVLEKLTDENISLYVDGLYQSLQWLIDDKLVESINIETEKEKNTLKVFIAFTKSDNEDNIIYSLDEKFKLLDL